MNKKIKARGKKGNSLIRTKIGVKLLIAVFCSLCVSLLLFVGLYFLSSWAVDKYSSTQYAQRKLIEFEEYVEHKGIMSSDFSTLTGWINKNDLKFMHIYRGEQLIFNSDDPIDDSYSYDERERDYYWDSRVIRFIERKEQIKTNQSDKDSGQEKVEQDSAGSISASGDTPLQKNDGVSGAEENSDRTDNTENTEQTESTESMQQSGGANTNEPAASAEADGSDSTTPASSSEESGVLSSDNVGIISGSASESVTERVYYEDLNVFIAVGTDMRLLIILLIISVIFSLIIFALLILRFVRRRFMYLSQISEEVAEIESGLFDKSVTVTGHDEIADLARNVDDMRISLMERLQSEKEAYDANRELITAMSHDLRTPLSALIGYLEIISAGVYSSEEQKEQYIQKSVEKAYQLKSMSDKLFDYFTVFKNDAPEELNLDIFNGQELLVQMISEQIYMMEERGYQFSFDVQESAENREYQLKIDSDALLRVFDNVFSNLLKYADKKEAIQVSVSFDGTFVKIIIKNRVNKAAVKVASTKIGLKSCRRLLERMGGQLRSKAEGAYYTVTIVLKKYDTSQEAPAD